MPSSYSNIVVMGFGNIGQALSSLLRMRFVKERILVIDEHMTPEQAAIARHYAMDCQQCRITRGNYIDLLSGVVGARTLVLNLATSIGCRDLIAWTQSRGAFYLDTCIDPWEYQDGVIDSGDNSNYEMRETVLDLMRQARQDAVPPTSTAVVGHGANPGFVSILVKEGMLKMQNQFLQSSNVPQSRAEWAALACKLGLRVIQVSEKDTQSTSVPRKQGEFVNTWSVDGYVAEALQPAELGWGTHEEAGPMAAAVGRHASGCQSAVFIKEMGARCEVKSWAPSAGEFVGNLISHNEAISLAHYLTVQDGAQASYRPTVYYAYHPSMQAKHSLNLLACGDRSRIHATRVLKDEIETGIDELGVLLISDQFPCLWIGSQLSIERAREMAPHNNATSLQVVGSVMAAIEWMLQSPAQGIVESESLDHSFIFHHAKPYWQPMVSEYRNWHPQGEQVDPQWTLDQFLSVRADESLGAGAVQQGIAAVCLT